MAGKMKRLADLQRVFHVGKSVIQDLQRALVSAQNVTKLSEKSGMLHAKTAREGRHPRLCHAIARVVPRLPQLRQLAIFALFFAVQLQAVLEAGGTS
jgi:hypothetical protein